MCVIIKFKVVFIINPIVVITDSVFFTYLNALKYSPHFLRYFFLLFFVLVLIVAYFMCILVIVFNGNQFPYKSKLTTFEFK